MSNLRTKAEHEALGGSPWSDYDSEYRVIRKTLKVPKTETPVETLVVDETEQGVDASSEHPPKRPRSIALAVVAANAVHAAWEAGYALGFNAGRLAGTTEAVDLGNPEFKPTYPPDGNPF